MHLQLVFALITFLLCDAKLTRKQHIQKNVTLSDKAYNELPPNPTQNSAAMRLIQIQAKSKKTSQIIDQYRVRHRREVFDSMSYESGLIWAHSERLDDSGDVVIRWVNSDSSITFRLEAKTLGYVGLGFNSAGNMKGADLVVAWVDDRNGIAKILDCHGLDLDNKVVADEVQNYELISGYQNKTHTTVEFRRQLDTCDKEDFIIGDDTTQILWALGPPGSDGELPKHVKSGSKPLRLLQPVPKPDTIPLRQWDVKLVNLTIPSTMATQFWCKIFKTPDLPTKHHIVGYEPIIDSWALRTHPEPMKTSESPVHHMVLYECAVDDDQHLWDAWAQNEGSYGPNRPSSWATCATPIAAWAMGSKGEFLPDNVGIPLGEKGGVTYYMLEVHYDNQALHKVLDSSGIRLHFTPSLRQHDAALLGAGIGVSALHVIPPKQKQFKTVGICSSECTEETMPEEGITIVSVLLHAHGTARKISLKHVRGNNELPTISEENSYDSRYQQSRVVPGGRKFMKGDTLLTECTYDSTSRKELILGGYSDSQEMCLSFILYYPRTNLAGCYSMTPVQEFFETFGVRRFYKLDFMQIENIFLTSGNYELQLAQSESESEAENAGTKNPTDYYGDVMTVQADDLGAELMKNFIIWEPSEFRNKTFMDHVNEMQWDEPLLTQMIQKSLYSGLHITFCKKRDDTWGVPIQIQNYPNFTEHASNNVSKKSCNYKSMRLPSTTSSASSIHISIYVLLTVLTTLR